MVIDGPRLHSTFDGKGLALLGRLRQAKSLTQSKTKEGHDLWQDQAGTYLATGPPPGQAQLTDASGIFRRGGRENLAQIR